MPRLHARHTTEIRYSRAVSQSVNEVRLTPLAGGRQRLEWSSLTAEPAARIETGRDGFGNAVYLLPSRHVRWQEPVDSLARSLRVNEDDGLVASLRALEAAVGEAISYTRGATRVDTPVEDVVRLRRGVCQDMAHLLIALCRRRGVAARYVSGWMHNPGRAGPGASHAWAEAAVPGHGWMEVDPTNPGRSLERHVRLAVGRDYDDVPPLRGRFRGRTAQELKVSVELHAVEG